MKNYTIEFGLSEEWGDCESRYPRNVYQWFSSKILRDDKRIEEGEVDE